VLVSWTFSTAELRAANQELEAFAHAVSHDLRAPLRAVSGFAVALVDDCGAVLPAEGRSHVDWILTSCGQMRTLIEGLLKLARCTRGGELQRETVDLSALAEQVLADLQRAEPERRVVWEVAPGLCAQGDRGMLLSVLQNLLGNAWKYSAGSVPAHIRVFAEPGSPVRYCVADDGAGFDMAHAGKLFRPFERLHPQDLFPGLGIGLATVQRIISRHGGELTFTAAPGAGATFRFTLPLDGD